VKVGCVADVHVANHRVFGGPYVAGLNRRCRQVLDVLSRAVDAAEDAGCEVFLVLGDLFDSTTPEPQVIAATQDALTPCGRMRVVLLMGNHDQVSTAEGDHALGPLRLGARVVEKPTLLGCPNGGDHALALVTFQPGPAKEWLPTVVAEMLRTQKHAHQVVPLLALHLGIEGKGTPPFLRGADDSVTVGLVRQLKDQHGIAQAVAGNWHSRRRYDGGVLQVGTLAPTGFDNPGYDSYGTLAIIDTEDPGGLHIKSLQGPRFLSIYGGPEEWANEVLLSKGKLQDCQVYLRWQTPPENLPDAQAAIAAAIDAGTLCGGEALPDVGEATAAARTAAHNARAASTLDEALASYVAEMPLGDGVDRDRVLQRARTYLQR